MAACYVTNFGKGERYKICQCEGLLFTSLIQLLKNSGYFIHR
ncbi:TPA: DUF2492 family protein [Morganella morganii]|nr:DUF2492 family protein [Morganella morganii]